MEMPVLLNKVIREGSAEKVTPEHRHDGGEKVGHTDGYLGVERF